MAVVSLGAEQVPQGFLGHEINQALVLWLVAETPRGMYKQSDFGRETGEHL
jgi:hypothetical protein